MEIDGVYLPDNPVKMVTVPDLKDACHPIRQVYQKQMIKNIYLHLDMHFF